MPGKFIPSTPQLHDYVAAHHTGAGDPLLAQLRAETQDATPASGMQITDEQGTLLSILAAVTQCKVAVEVGTFTGASSLCIARGLADDAHLFCFDQSDEWTQIARKYWDKAGVSGKITLTLGPGGETVRAWAEESAREGRVVDFAFIDADKPGYDDYYEALLPIMRVGGLFVFDNMLRRGRVVVPEERNEEDKMLDALNYKLAHDPRVESVLLTVADGLHLCRKR